MTKGLKYSLGMTLLIVALFVVNLLVGSVKIPASEVLRILLLGEEGSKASWSFILWESRLPQAITALLCGGALSVCGLMLQTAFNNPLAGPSILGINSGVEAENIRKIIDDALYEFNISKENTLRYCLMEITNDEIVKIMKSQLMPNDYKDIVNQLNEE